MLPGSLPAIVATEPSALRHRSAVAPAGNVGTAGFTLGPGRNVLPDLCQRRLDLDALAILPLVVRATAPQTLRYKGALAVLAWTAKAIAADSHRLGIPIRTLADCAGRPSHHNPIPQRDIQNVAARLWIIG